ncbi:MAG: fibronectin type III domain-containing protein [Alphaproteobacteria bacterium]|nr:fibronectin type III domain-containing protein [Alphaproteobacteria bacterium]
MAAMTRYRGTLFGLVGSRYQTVGEFDFTTPAVPSSPPATPTGLTTSLTYSSATLTWGAAARAEWYEVRLSTSPTWTSLTDVLSYEFTGLMPETDYRLELRAGNAAGYSATAHRSVTTPAAPVRGAGDGLADIRYEVTQADDTALDVTRRVIEFSYRYGANVTNPDNQPLRLRSEGYLHLENSDGHFSDADMQGWSALAVYAGMTKVFVLWIGEVKEGQHGKALLDVKGLASRSLAGKVPVEVGVGTSNQSLAGYLAASGVPLKPIAKVTMPAMSVAAGARYNGRVITGTIESHFHNDVDRFLDEVSGFGSLLALEDPLVEQWNAYPLPPGSHDSRNALAALTRHNAFILDSMRTYSFPDWRRDAQRFRRLKTATEVISITATVNSQARYWKRRSSDNRWVINTSLASKFGDAARRFITHHGTPRVTGVSGTNNPGRHQVKLEYQGDRLILVWQSDQKPQVYNAGGGVEANHPLWKWKCAIGGIFELTEGPAYSEHTYLASGNESEFGHLPFPVMPIPVDGGDNTTTEAAIASILQRQEAWVGDVATLALVLLQGEEAWLERKAGDVVNVTAGELRHRAIIAAVRVKQLGGKPLQLEWSLLLVSPIGSAAEMQDNTVRWRGASVEWNASLLTFGPDPAHEYGLYFGGHLLSFSYEDVFYGRDTLNADE